MKYPFILLIKCYQFFISPWLGSNCRFTPTCSEYAKNSFAQHGALKGLYLSVRRILRCNPFANAGYDPVPDSPDKNDRHSSQ
ncbi:MAG: membrane protein insertion efficiency factor YidD [Rickettsiaceae bacterium]|nr:membrane protein insertion efficiency factor YidD [Rickettsiaceae bacterium]